MQCGFILVVALLCYWKSLSSRFVTHQLVAYDPACQAAAVNWSPPAGLPYGHMPPPVCFLELGVGVLPVFRSSAVESACMRQQQCGGAFWRLVLFLSVLCEQVLVVTGLLLLPVMVPSHFPPSGLDCSLSCGSCQPGAHLVTTPPCLCMVAAHILCLCCL